MPKLEKNIQADIEIALGKYGRTFRTNAGMFYGGKKIHSDYYGQDILVNLRYIKGLPEGFSDLLYVGDNGKIAFIECKTLTGKKRKQQEVFINLMKSLGYAAGFVRSVEDALELIKDEN